jgi:hypothetical protein
MHVSLGEIDVDVDLGGYTVYTLESSIYMKEYNIIKRDNFFFFSMRRKGEKRDIIRLQKRREMAKRCRVSSR